MDHFGSRPAWGFHGGLWNVESYIKEIARLDSQRHAGMKEMWRKKGCLWMKHSFNPWIEIHFHERNYFDPITFHFTDSSLLAEPVIRDIIPRSIPFCYQFS